MDDKGWKSCCIGCDVTIRDAAVAIDRAGLGIALIVDSGMRLVGTVTDGDIRRALLAAASLEEPILPHANKNSRTVSEHIGRGEALDLMQAHLIRQIPIIDNAGRVSGLHLLHEIIGVRTRENWCVIMAGGRGTRLGELTQSTPKPMLRVAGRPIIERLVWHLVVSGVRRIFIAVNYLADQIESHFGDGSRFGCSIEYLREKESLGTGGPLALLPEAPSTPVLVCNGDLVTQADLGALFDFHGKGGFRITIGTRTHTHQVPFGCIETNGDRVTGFEEKPVLARMISAGVYVLDPDLVARVPCAFYPITGLFEDCLKRGEPVGAFEIEGDWIDVGQKEQLRQARGENSLHP